MKITDLDDWVVESFRARAKEAGRSLEQELRQFLTEAAQLAQALHCGAR